MRVQRDRERKKTNEKNKKEVKKEKMNTYRK
jgi:hypothetical protein